MSDIYKSCWRRTPAALTENRRGLIAAQRRVWFVTAARRKT